MRCTNTPNSVKVDFYTSKCKKKVKFNRKIVSLVGESFYTKGCKSVKVNFYTLWCNGQHSKEYPKRPQKIGNLSWCNSNLGGYFSPFLNFQDLPFSVQKMAPSWLLLLSVSHTRLVKRGSLGSLFGHLLMPRQAAGRLAWLLLAVHGDKSFRNLKFSLQIFID